MRPDGPRDPVVGPDGGPEPPFPLRLDGKVIKGFGRGSKELGIPTANIPIEGLSVGGIEDVESGVYYGWAGLSPSAVTSQGSEPGLTRPLPPSANDAHSKAAVYPMVMSIGWNPYYKNTVRSVEVHIMHHFATDFYGSHMNLMILGFIRPEYDYVSKESLIDDIRTDIDVAAKSLERDAYAGFRDDSYLLGFSGKSDTAE